MPSTSFTLFDAPYPEHSAASAFSGNRLNRFSERRSETCVKDAMADPNARLLVVAFGKLLLRETDGALNGIFTVADLDALNAAGGTIVLLGWDQKGCPWLAAQSALCEEDLPNGISAVDFRSVYIQGLLDDEQLGMLAQGGALLAWHKSHQFCSKCGHPSEIKDGGYKRLCPSCEAQHFPRTDPVVIMLTVSPDNESCLLGRSPHFPGGMYSCLAGFVEPGETIEQAMRRETKEEAGIDVTHVQYHASQPWPFPYTLMIGCFGVAATTEITIDDELDDARWFSRADVQKMVDGTHPEGFKMPPKGAIASNLVMHWLTSKG
ncbi:MAG: NAD(+) diphosphatase [Ahrensia sp.]|nr:NAD(+) diphosphatase [Ahrensia sp.]